MLSNNNKLAFAARLREVMEDRGMTQMQLANLVGVAQSRISEWRAGKAMPQRRVGEALAEHLYLNVEWLIEGTGPKEPKDKSQYQLATAAAIAKRLQGEGFSDDQVQTAFEASESVIREGAATYGTDWRQRAKEAEDRALEAERKLDSLYKRLRLILADTAGQD